MAFRKILVMGLPGAGKTTLSKVLARKLNATHFNADEVRAEINTELGFSTEDREEHARRMGWLCDQVVASGNFAIADFVCPTTETRAAFMEGGPAYLIFVDRIEKGRYEDTNKLFQPPYIYDLRVRTVPASPEYWAEQVRRVLRPVFDPKKPTALFIGRYQPFHAGHLALITEGIKRVGQVCVAVRDTQGTDDKNPFGFEYVRSHIESGLREFEGKYNIIPLPNITNVMYGRDVGYVVEQIKLDADIEAVSATGLRKAMSK